MHTSSRRTAQALLLVAPLTLAGCHRHAGPRPVDKAAIETTIRKHDAHWVKAAATHNVDEWVAFYADDAAVLPPNAKTLTDKAAIHDYFAHLFSAPGLNLAWTSDKVDVADAGDMAYTYGTYTLTMDGAKGKSVVDTGKNLEIWKKKPTGEWQCVVDTWSTDKPEPGM